MTSASMSAQPEPKLRGRLLYGPRRARRHVPKGLDGRVGRAALRPRDGEAGLQGHQRELAPQLGTRRRKQLLPKRTVLGERTLEHAGGAGVLLELREPRAPQPLDVVGLETEQ